MHSKLIPKLSIVTVG